MEQKAEIEKNVRTPVQQRAKAKKNRIVEAAYTLMKENGFEATNVRRIAQKANVSIGTIYSYFSDKKAIYYEVSVLYRDELFRYLNDAMDSSLEKGESLEETIYSFIMGFKNAIELNFRFHKENIVLALTNDWISRIYIKMEADNANTIGQRFFEKFKNRITVSDQAVTTMLVHKTIEEVIQYVLFFDIDIPRDKVFREMAKMIAGYLKTPAA